MTMLILFCSLGYASHYRFGVVTATRLSETSTTVTYRLNISESWRLGTAPGSSFFSISGGNSGSFSASMTTVTDPSGGWSNSSGTYTVTLNKTSTPTKIEYTSCCKISTIVNNHDSSWDEFIILNTAAPGSSPVSTLPAIINMPVGAASATYTIPASDPDAGSTLTFGTPSFTGALSGQSEPSGFSINSTTGQISLNTIGKSVGQTYNAMVTVKDNDGNTIELDFLIKMVGASIPPVFDYSVTPADGAVFNVIAGQNISFPIKATDSDAGSSVSLSVSGLPSYITTGNFSSAALPATGNPSVTTFSWTPAFAQIGSTVVLNFIATDNVGVQSTSSVTIKVVAEPAPDFISPSPTQNSLRQIVSGNLFTDVIVAQSSLGSNVSIAFATGIPSGATLSPAVPTVGANPGQTTLTWTPSPADFGTHSLQFQATISAIPSIFSTLNYQLIVNTPPQFSSAPLTSVIVGQSYSYNVTVSDLDIPYGDVISIVGTSIPAWLTLTSTGNGTAVLSGTPTAANVGEYVVSLATEDTYHHGNPAAVEQNFTITVIEPAPVAICQNIVVQLDNNGGATISANDVNNGSYSLVGISSMTVSQTQFNCSNIGDNQIDLVVFNSYGNSDTCTATVTVQDQVAPTVSAQDVTVQLDANGNASITAAQIDNGSADACGIASVSVSPNAFTCANVGANTVTLTVTDNNGNTSSTTATVTVQDNIAPSISCGGDVSVVADRNDCTPVVTWDAPVASDNCTYSVSSTHNSGDRFPVGTTTVVYTVTDASGNTASCSFNVTVTPNPLVASVTAKTYVGGYNVSCYGKNNGEATVSVDGGCLPYSYSWNTSPVQTGATASNLFAGTYVVTITDANHQVISKSITLTQPAELLANAGNNATVYYGYTPSSCANLSGSATGGTLAYSYSWSNGASISTTQVCPSTSSSYTLTVTDANGCVASDAVTVCAINVQCEKGGKAIIYYEGGKVLVCHVPGGDLSKRETLCIAPSAVPDHLAHGDKLGICGVNSTCFDATGKAINEDAGVDNIDLSTHIKAFPNPFNNKTTLEFSVGQSERTFIEIYDLKGSMLSKVFDGATIDGQVNRVDVDATFWENGIYFARIVNENQVQYFKLVVTK